MKTFKQFRKNIKIEVRKDRDGYYGLYQGDKRIGGIDAPTRADAKRSLRKQGFEVKK